MTTEWEWQAWFRYSTVVRKMTDQTLYSMGVGETRPLQVDHVVAVWHGFRFGVDPALMASRENLSIVTREENLKKGLTLTLQAVELLRSWGYFVPDPTEQEVLLICFYCGVPFRRLAAAHKSKRTFCSRDHVLAYRRLHPWSSGPRGQKRAATRRAS